MVKKAFVSIVRFIFWLVALTAAISLLFPSHPILGMILNLIRWPVLVVLVFMTWKKRKGHKKVKEKLIWGLAVLLLLQWSWKKVTYTYATNSVESSAVQFNLATYNLFFKNKQPQSALQLINTKEVDFLAFQEVTSTWQNQLIQTFGQKLPYHTSFPHRSAYGMAVFSKYPIRKIHYLKNSNGLPFAQIVQLKVASKTVAIANVHLSSPAIAVEQPERFFPLFIQNASIRAAQLDELLAYMASLQVEIKILAGDFNSMKFEPNYDLIRKEYVDLFAKKGQGRSVNFPHTAGVPFPLLTLDYMFVKGDCKPVACEVLKGGSSDHLPVWGKVEL